MQGEQGRPVFSTAQIVTLGAWLLLAIIINHWITWAILVFLALGVVAHLVTRAQQQPKPASKEQVQVHMTMTRPPRPQPRQEAPPMLRQTVTAALAHHGLTSWWEGTYSQEERDAITARLKEIQVGAATAGSLHGTAAQFLANLAQDFKRSDRVHLGVPMLEQALTYKMSGIDEYYLLGQFITQRYKQRSQDPTAVADVIRACERTIELIPTLRKEWTARYGQWDGFPPSHVGFGRLIAIRKRQKNHAEVAQLEALYEDLWGQHTIDAVREAREGTQNRTARWSSQDPYAVLGVNKGANAESVRDAYLSLSKQYHPDRVANLGPEFGELAETRMKAINGAYSALKDRSGN